MENLKLCLEHCHKATSLELQLLHALGQAGLLEDLLPCHIECFYRACEDYLQEHSYLDPVFQVIAAWLEHPLCVAAWARCAPGPGAPAAQILQGLRAVAQEAAPSATDPVRQGLGLAACLQFLGAARPAEETSAAGTSTARQFLQRGTPELHAEQPGPAPLAGRAEGPRQLLQDICTRYSGKF